MNRLAGMLYTKGLTQEQVSDVFTSYMDSTTRKRASAVWLNV